ncbi:WD repeat-containing protein 6, partial [Kappamyces sp. JEL0680]
FVRDGMIASISEDASCRVWDVKSQACLACWEGHGSRHVWSFAVDPQEKVLVRVPRLRYKATGGGDGGIRLWDLDHLSGHEYEDLDSMEQIPVAYNQK